MSKVKASHSKGIVSLSHDGVAFNTENTPYKITFTDLQFDLDGLSFDMFFIGEYVGRIQCYSIEQANKIQGFFTMYAGV